VSQKASPFSYLLKISLPVRKIHTIVFSVAFTVILRTHSNAEEYLDDEDSD